MEAFCRTHGLFSDTELRDPDCVFEDGFGNVIAPEGDPQC